MRSQRPYRGLASGYAGSDFALLDPRLQYLASCLPGGQGLDMVAQWPRESGRDPLMVLDERVRTTPGFPLDGPASTRRTRISHRGTSLELIGDGRTTLTGAYEYYFMQAGFVLDTASETAALMMVGDNTTFGIGIGFGIGVTDWITPGNYLVGIKYGVAWTYPGHVGAFYTNPLIGTGFHTATVLFTGAGVATYDTHFFLDGVYIGSDGGLDYYNPPILATPSSFAPAGTEVNSWPSSGVHMVYALAGVTNPTDNAQNTAATVSASLFPAGPTPVMQFPKARRRHYSFPAADIVLVGQACL